MINIEKIEESFREEIGKIYRYLKGKDTNRNLYGDVYEIAIRERLKEMFPKYNIGYGIIYTGEKKSLEMDVIVFWGKAKFQIGDFVIVSPDKVKAVVQVKGYIPSPKNDFVNIVNNINSARILNKDIMGYCFVVTANSVRSFEKHINYFKEKRIGYFAYWNKPGDHADVIEGKGGIRDFFHTIYKDIS